MRDVAKAVLRITYCAASLLRLSIGQGIGLLIIGTWTMRDISAAATELFSGRIVPRLRRICSSRINPFSTGWGALTFLMLFSTVHLGQPYRSLGRVPGLEGSIGEAIIASPKDRKRKVCRIARL